MCVNAVNPHRWCNCINYYVFFAHIHSQPSHKSLVSKAKVNYTQIQFYQLLLWVRWFFFYYFRPYLILLCLLLPFVAFVTRKMHTHIRVRTHKIKWRKVKGLHSFRFIFCIFGGFTIRLVFSFINIVFIIFSLTIPFFMTTYLCCWFLLVLVDNADMV